MRMQRSLASEVEERTKHKPPLPQAKPRKREPPPPPAAADGTEAQLPDKPDSQKAEDKDNGNGLIYSFFIYCYKKMDNWMLFSFELLVGATPHNPTLIIEEKGKYSRCPLHEHQK